MEDQDRCQRDLALDDTAVQVSRRAFMKTTAGAVGVLGGAALLNACGGSAATGTGTTTGRVQRGGTLRAAFSGGGSTDTLNPFQTVNNLDNARTIQLYEWLVGLDINAQPKLILADEVTPNKDATEWTVRVKKGITFHSGKEVTADDILWMLQYSTAPKSTSFGAPLITLVDHSGLKKIDRYTVRVPCLKPFSTFMEALTGYYFWVVPAGFDPKKPIGTGPFKYESFTPGQQSIFTRNENYWQSGLPYLDKVAISDYADEQAQVNALLGGQADVINLLSAASISAVTGGGQEISIANGGQWNPFCMNVDVAPFNDVRVRQALRLLTDRQQFLETVFDGHGTIGNDLYAIWDQVYAREIPQRTQDIGQAKALLKAAGKSDLAIELVTSDIAQGVVAAAQVYAQQAKQAGVKVTIRQVTATDLYGPNYRKWPFSQDQWTYNAYFPQVTFSDQPAAEFNETHYGGGKYLALNEQALATVDVNQRTEIAHEMQQMYFNNSGYIIPCYSPAIDGRSSKLHGVQESKVGIPFNNYNFREAWFSA